MIEATEIKRMSLTERLQTMELLWDSLSQDQLESPAWHETVLSSRLSKAESGTGKFLTLGELKMRLNKKQG